MPVHSLRAAGIAWGLAVAGLGALPRPAPAEPLRILNPVDGAVIHSPSALLVFAAPAGTAVSVGVGRSVLPLPDVTMPGGRGEEIHHLWVPLPDGKSQVRLLDARGVEELARLSVNRVGVLGPRAPVAGAFHTAEREGACSGCHSWAAPEEGAGAPAGPFCQPCHPDTGAAPYLHGPSAVAACFSCHETRYAPARFGQRLPQPSSCAGCHTDLMARVLGGRKFVHGPVAAGECTACHDPHGGQTATLLRGTVSGLCLSCHDSRIRRAWSVLLHEKVPCTGCHDPHGGQTPKLTLAQGNDLCKRCHVEPAFNPLGHALFGHPLGEVADPSRPGATFGCMSCHPPHGVNDVSRRRIESDEGEQRAFCLGCHR